MTTDLGEISLCLQKVIKGYFLHNLPRRAEIFGYLTRETFSCFVRTGLYP